MNPALGPFAIAAVLLVLAGGLKAIRPQDTARALRGVGFPAGESVVRLGGAVEAILGVAALVAVDVFTASFVAASYAAFFTFVIIALARRLPIATCGCFGKVDTPPSVLHVGIAVGACTAALGLVVDPSRSPLDALDWPFLESAAFVLLVAGGVFASFLLLTLLPRALASPTAR